MGSSHTTLLITMGKEKNIFDFFSQSAIQQFKEAFGIMDINKNGILEADDLVQAFTNVGKSVSAGEAQAMLDETSAPVNFTKMVLLFADEMAGKIDAEMFRHSLMTFGDKFSAQECEDAFAEFQIEDGMIDGAHLKGLMVAKK